MVISSFGCLFETRDYPSWEISNSGAIDRFQTSYHFEAQFSTIEAHPERQRSKSSSSHVHRLRKCKPLAERA